LQLQNPKAANLPACKEVLARIFPPVNAKRKGYTNTKNLYLPPLRMDNDTVLEIKDKNSIANKIYLVAVHISCDIRENGGTYKVPTFITRNLLAYIHIREIE